MKQSAAYTYPVIMQHKGSDVALILAIREKWSFKMGLSKGWRSVAQPV